MKDEELRGFGFKATGPRLKILHILESAGSSHMSAEAIYQELSQNGDDVALATVYRVLAQFEQVGLVLSHQFLKVQEFCFSPVFCELVPTNPFFLPLMYYFLSIYKLLLGVQQVNI